MGPKKLRLLLAGLREISRFDLPAESGLAKPERPLDQFGLT